MRREVRLTVHGVPVPKGRPRLGRGRTYTPEATRVAEETLGWAMKQACPDGPLRGPLRLTVAFVMPLPKRKPAAWDKRLWADTLAGKHHEAHLVRPDGDNLLKTVLDAGNGILWTDDAQVCWYEVRKMYGAEPGTDLKLRLL